MRLRLLFIPLTVVAVVALVAVACGGDSETGGREGASDEGPQSSGLVAQDTFLTFEGRLYRLTDTLQADLIDDRFTEVGVASKADIDFDGGLTVFRRQGDDEAVYTFSPAAVEEEAAGGGQPGGVATEDLPVDEGEPDQPIADDPPERRDAVNPPPGLEPDGEEPAVVTDDAVDMVDAEEVVSSGLWLRWEPEP